MNVTSFNYKTICVFLLLVCLSAVDSAAQGRSTMGRSMTGTTSSSDAATTYRSGQAWEALIQIDTDTSSIIVITDDEANEQIGKIIKDLDRPMPQVLIKVVFLEVTHRDDLDLGVKAKFDHGMNDRGHVVESNFDLPLASTGGIYRIIENDLEVTMNAIAEVGKLEILSRPSILARHNQEAVITIGQEVPFIRNSRVTQDGQTINTVEYEDIGIILRVTPFITTDGLVEMVVAPEISTLTGETVPISDNINAPVFAKRAAETRVVLPDGHTVVIGGLMEDNKTETTSKVPILGDIPLLGMAFRHKVKEDAKTELLIFLTPHIVEAPSHLAEVSDAEKANSVLAPKAFSEDQMKKFFNNPED